MKNKLIMRQNENNTKYLPLRRQNSQTMAQKNNLNNNKNKQKKIKLKIRDYLNSKDAKKNMN